MKLQEDDKKLLKKADALLKDIEQNPYDRIGKPESLAEDLTGFWSRRIDLFNRIVYQIIEKDGEKYIEIAQCGTHYHK